MTVPLSAVGVVGGTSRMRGATSTRAGGVRTFPLARRYSVEIAGFTRVATAPPAPGLTAPTGAHCPP